MLERGRVVRSVAGRDTGYLLAVMQADENSVLVCDGKERPIDRPKSKNIRHVETTVFVLEEQDLVSNRALRRALRRLISENDCNIQEVSYV